jgi:hypothetical protein
MAVNNSANAPGKTPVAEPITREFLTPELAAKRYKVSTAWLATCRKEKSGPPYIEMGKKFLYPTPEVDQWFLKKLVSHD